jgi:small subunit ribosomal protein S10
MSKARINLESDDSKSIDFVISQIKTIASTLKMKVIGPIPLPTKKLIINTRRTPCGDGSDTYEHWRKRISKRIIEIEGDEKSIRQILRIKVPENVYVKINVPN